MVGRRLIALALLAALAGCGPRPPQAPGPQAHRLNEALSRLSTACGHAVEIQAFTNSARDMAVTEHQAQAQVPALVAIYRQDPGWVFQGKTVRQLVTMSASYLDECGLHAAARSLRESASGR